MDKKLLKGHITAIITIAVWGTTYISTKILLDSFSPTEILITRFVMGYIFLWILHPKNEKTNNKKHELLFAGAGIFGTTIYYLLESLSLVYTSASNVGVIIAAAPILTAILVKLLFKGEKPLGTSFYIGLVLAFIGIALISFNGARLKLNPKGDFLALLGALAWAVYSVFIKTIEKEDYNVTFVTRRIFFWGIVTMLPIAIIGGFHPSPEKLDAKAIFNLLYLGIGASAICFVTWNYAMKIVGAVKTSVYIYLTPVVTIITSIIVLNERLTIISATGTALTLLGLILSENPIKRIKN